MRGKTLEELAQLIGAEVEGDAALVVSGPAGLDSAVPGEISFLSQDRYSAKLETTRATAALVRRDATVERGDLSLLRCDDPEGLFTQVALAFAPEIPEIPIGVDPAAFVDPSATVDPSARVAGGVTIGPRAVIGADVVLHPGVRVGAHCRVGEGCTLYYNVVLYPRVELGARCIVHACSVLGGDGFGFHFEDGQWVKIPQVGNVVLEDDVEIGANVSVDCGRYGATRIGRGVKIDNQVHVAHNVQLGEGTLLLAHVGIAGSTTVGRGVIIAGQAGVTGHVHIGDGARVSAGAGVTKSIPAGAHVFGFPAGPRAAKLRAMASAERAGSDISKLKAELKELRSMVKALTNQAPNAEGGVA